MMFPIDSEYGCQPDVDRRFPPELDRMTPDDRDKERWRERDLRNDRRRQGLIIFLASPVRSGTGFFPGYLTATRQIGRIWSGDGLVIETYGMSLSASPSM